MWVSGDLKDRLGIRHRKESKNARISSDPETAPMFREPHARSASELTSAHVYEPRRVLSESPDANEKRHVGSDGSLEVERTTTPPPLINVGSSEMVNVQAKKADPLMMSSHASYYSSSDIPIPSQIPPALYRFPNGEIGEKSSHSRGTSSTSPTSVIPPPPKYGAQSPSSMGTGAAGESFEMQVRHAPSHSRSASQGFRQHVLAYPGDEAYRLDPDEASRSASVQEWKGGRAL